MILYSHNIICHRTYFKIWKIFSFFAIFDSLSIPTTSQRLGHRFNVQPTLLNLKNLMDLLINIELIRI